MKTLFMRHALRKLPLYSATAATLVTGAVISVLLYNVLREAEQARNTFDFTRRVEGQVALVKRAFDEAGEALRATNLLFRAADTVDDTQFAKFTRPLLDTYPYLQGLTWYRFVRGDERAAYEAERRKLWPDFTIRERSAGRLVPAAPRPLYLVLDMVEPPERNKGVRGYDIWSFPVHQEAAQRSIDSGRVFGTGLINVLPPPNQLGMVLELPVYGPLPPRAGVAERRAAVRGLSEVLIDIPALVRQNLQRDGMAPYPGIEFILSGQAIGTSTMIEAGRYGSLASARANFWSDLTGAAMLDRTERFMVAGQNWTTRPATACCARSANACWRWRDRPTPWRGPATTSSRC